MSGARSRSACSGVARMADDHRREPGPRAVGREDERGEHLQLVRRVGDRVPVEAQQVPGGVDRVGDQPARDHPERVQPVRQRRGDPEVPATAAQRPEQVGIGLLAHLGDRAVGGHQLDRHEVVGGEPVPGHQPAEPAAERQAGDPGGRDRAARDGQPVLRGRIVELAPQDAALGPHGPGVGVDLDPLHLGQVDHHRVIGDRAAGDVVAAAPDADVEPFRTGEAQGRRGVGRGPAAHDDGRPAVDQPVVDPSGLVVAAVVRLDDLAADAGPELIEPGV